MRYIIRKFVTATISSLQGRERETQDGLDIAKCLALGVTLGGMAGQFLKTAAISTDNVVDIMKLTKRQIEVTMFAAGAKDLQSLANKLAVV